MSPPAITRKRSRAHLLDQDEISTEPQRSTPPLASIKKRKLNTHGTSPVAGLAPLSQKIDRLSGFGKNEKENARVPEDPEEADELAERDIYDFLDEDEDMSERRKAGTPRTRNRVTPNKTNATKEKGSGKVSSNKKAKDKAKKFVFEVPEEEPAVGRRSVRKLGDQVGKVEAPSSPARENHPEVIIRRPRGRPRKSQILKEDKKLSNKARRESLRAVGDHDNDEEVPAEALVPPKKRKTRASEQEETESSPAPEPQTNSTVKKRGRPRNVIHKIIESKTDTLRGILTPTRHRTGRPRKSVAFDEGEAALDLGFKDIPTAPINKAVAEDRESSKEPDEDLEEVVQTNLPDTKTRVAKSRKALVVEEVVDSESEDDEDDIACAICSGLDSKKRNPILLCDGDGCDFAAHKDCYQVAKVPKGDWFCKTCRPDTSDSIISPPQLDKELILDAHLDNIPEIEGFEGHLQRMQQILLQKLTGQKRIKIQGHDEEMQKVYQVVEQTVQAGEGNSMLVIGARGCGKTTLVESIISELSIEHRENFHVVRLNGFIHTDDKLALKETWRQLGREMEVEDDVVGKTSNAADTLASLLALLSHPSEISESESDQIAKSVIFVLDEFNLFTIHPRQTLLYNLFDIAQARKAPIVVLGLTTRIDVAESLEKRVKSRFSHRYVHLSLPKSLPAFWDICKEALTVNTEEPDAEGFDTGIAGQDEFLAYWQSMIDDLFTKDPIFKRHLQSYFYRTKSVSAFFTSCIQPIVNLSLKSLPLAGKTFTSNPLSLSAPDSKLQIIQGLSELELALLIAAARLDIILDTDTCNFAMAYDEYSSLTSRHKIQTSSTGVTALGSSAKVWGRAVALGAWERLAKYELLVPAAIGGGGRDTGSSGRMWKIDVALEEITGSVEGLGGVMAKWCREI